MFFSSSARFLSRLSSAFLLIAGCSAQASGNWVADMSVGYLHAKMEEYVYNTPSNIANGQNNLFSRLDWRVDPSAVLNARLAYKIGKRFLVGVSLWTKISDANNSSMDDWDWYDEVNNTGLPSGSAPNYHSWHDNTNLNSAYHIDWTASFDVWQSKNLNVAILAGYQYTKFNLEAVGGQYQYPTGSGTFPNVPVINYTQEYKLPYIGLLLSADYNKWDAALSFKYSNGVTSSETDYHYRREQGGLEFFGDGSGSEYYGLSARLGYALNKTWRVFLKGDWNKFKTVGITEYGVSIVSNAFLTAGNSGYSLEYYALSLGLSAQF